MAHSREAPGQGTCFGRTIGGDVLILPEFPMRALPALSLCLLLMSAAAAADEPVFRIAPHVGGRAGGGFEDSDSGDDRDLEESGSLALALELRHGPGTWWQLWYSRQESEIVEPAGKLDVDVEYLHVGGTAPISEGERVNSFVSGGLGATRFSPGASGYDDETRFSLSLGVGLEIPFSERAALRLEARGYMTLMDSDSAVFCRTGGEENFCRIIASGSSLLQFELLAGLAFAF
jgi:opacity protein-like surface antigen